MDQNWERDSASAEFAALLERVFLANIELSSLERKKELAVTISPAMERLGSEKAHLFLEEARKRIMDVGGKTAHVEDGRRLEILAADNRRLRAQLDECMAKAELHAAAYDHLQKLSDVFLQDDAHFQTKEQIGVFCDRVREVLVLLYSSFRELLKGRKAFQEKFNIYLDRFDPTRTQDFRIGAEEFVWRRLLEWTDSGNAKKQLFRFAFVVDELKYHQLALLRGYGNCIKGGTLNAISELSPPKLEKQLKQRYLPLGPFKIPCRWFPWKKRLVYQEFCRRYKELVEEDEKYFNEKFDPFLVEGYVELIKQLELVRRISQTSTEG